MEKALTAPPQKGNGGDIEMGGDNDKDQLFRIAMAKEGIQGADVAYYALLFLPLITGLASLGVWVRAVVFMPNIPQERLNPLLAVSVALIGVPIAGGYLKDGK